ncbi:MAG: PTS glucose transporter subunit IIA [Coriobacteriaceae bacterium]|nr:PTS glucose transporter subunit IIA [Coriobacteriaceae bacterium]
MGIFGKLSRRRRAAVAEAPRAITAAAEPGCVLSPVDGVAKPLSEVSDPVFAQGMLGPGMAVEPSGNVIYAPVMGTVTAAVDTGHAFGLTSDDGMEVLIHVGVDTVDMKGNGFDVLAGKDDHVTAGTPLVVFDREKIRAAGHDDIVMVSLTNASGEVVPAATIGEPIRAGEPLFRLSGKA